MISNIFWGKQVGKTGRNGGKIRKRKKRKKELGLVVSQQTVIRNQAKTQRRKNRKKLILGIFFEEKGRGKWEKCWKIRKRKKQKRIRPNGRRIRNLQVEISLSPNFGAERTLIDPISVTSKFHIFYRFLALN